MKKNILFIIPSLSAGGGEKSLVNLLSHIDYELFNVDLFMLNHEGIFMDYLPKQVNVLLLPSNYKTFTLPLIKSVVYFLLKGNVILAYNRLVFTICNRLIREISRREQYTWKYVERALEKLEKKYDVAIGFLEKTSTYFCVDKVNAARKIGWIHIDYDKLGMDPDFDIKYFEQLDKIITVSEECANIFNKRFPSQREKINVIYNIVSPTLINQMANQDYIEINKKAANEVTILSIGRLNYQKGFEMAVMACKLLVDKGYKIKWNIIGEGEERDKLEKLIKNYGVEDYIKLLGLKSNPYPFIKQADIYVQTSRFEGKAIAIDEAKILQKPIVVTNYNTAKDQLVDRINGLIVEMNPEGIAEGIEKLILNNELKKYLVKNLSQESLGTESEIEKLYKIL
jgi:glycosyltransferase involved in cell wall biosynthesis